ncbi:alpha-glucosidase [Kocuria kalidii]|uniref:alpha-glucosidase n=1 Tax=Kocuria kalidii TaxID=3376283 RepID=UPI0037B04A5E
MDARTGPGGITRRAVLGVAGAAAAGRMASGPAAAQEDTAAAGLLPSTTHQVGPFLLRLRTGAAPALRISHRAEPDRVLWQGPASGGFLQAGTAETVVEQNTTAAGGFTVGDRLMVRHARQSVTSATLRAGSLVLEGTLTSVPGTAIGYTMTFSGAGPRRLRFRVRLASTAQVEANRIFLRYASDATEAFWGFGAQMTHLDQKGRLLPVLVQEQGVGRGLPVVTQLVSLLYGPRTAGNWATTSISVPQYLTSHNRSLLLENTEYCVFDLRDDDLVEVENFTADLTGQIVYGRTPLELIETCTEVTGRMRALPDWLHDGAVVCAQGGTAKVAGLAATLAEAQVPVAAFWVQDWGGVNTTDLGEQVQWNWVLDTRHYPDWGELRETIGERLGARVVLYVSPFLTDLPGYDQLYTEAARAGYLVRNQQGDVYRIRNSTFTAGLLDLSDPAARAWIKATIQSNLVGSGAVGWMADFGEALPFDAVLHDGADPMEWHNRYPVEWARINREVIDEAGLGTEGLFFNRSGHLHSPGLSTLFWMADQIQSWDAHDGLRSAITGALSSGMSGFSLTHSDIGGFTPIGSTLPGTGVEVSLLRRSKELLLRWAEYSAFTPVMRTHDGIDPAAAWQIDQDGDTLAAFRHCVQMYRAWAPYRRRLVDEAARTGHPVMRALALHHPHDPVAARQQFQYLLGDAVLVHPVTEPGITEAQVYLPAGTWTHVWTNRRYAGPGHATVPAPLGRPPVFLRAGARDAGGLSSALRRLVQEDRGATE